MKKIDLKMRIKDFDFGYGNGTIQLRLEQPSPLNKKFVTMLDLVTSRKDELLRIKRFGNLTMMRLEDKLDEYDLWLGMTPMEVNDYQGEEIVKEEKEEQGLSQKEWEDRVFRAALEIEVELIRHGKEYNVNFRSMEQDAAYKAFSLVKEVRFKLSQKEE